MSLLTTIIACGFHRVAIIMRHHPRLYCYDIAQHAIVAQLEVPVSDICIDDNNLYIISSSWNNLTYSYDIAYAKVNVDSRTKVADNFIDDGSDADIIMPYGIAVNPVTKDILITDVHNYVTPGTVYCFDATGKKNGAHAPA